MTCIPENHRFTTKAMLPGSRRPCWATHPVAPDKDLFDPLFSPGPANRVSKVRDYKCITLPDNKYIMMSYYKSIALLICKCILIGS